VRNVAGSGSVAVRF